MTDTRSPIGVEGKLRSDVVVDSTVATLAKRGTEGWQMRVEPMTGRFKISLAEYGLVDAVSKLRAAGRMSRTVRPGEYVTEGAEGQRVVAEVEEAAKQVLATGKLFTELNAPFAL